MVDTGHASMSQNKPSKGLQLLDLVIVLAVTDTQSDWRQIMRHELIRHNEHGDERCVATFWLKWAALAAALAIAAECAQPEYWYSLYEDKHIDPYWSSKN